MSFGRVGTSALLRTLGLPAASLGLSAAVLGLLTAVSLASSGCSTPSNPGGPSASASVSPSAVQLSPELRDKVLAKVGDVTITLGDYAAALERLDRFERLRYQTPERRRALLEELIEVELLAQEAKRRGFHQRPEVQEQLRYALREELRRKLQEQLPTPDQLPETAVRAYYDAHRAEFDEPERRRVAHIVVVDEQTAKKVLVEATGATGARWGELFAKYSLDAAGESRGELAGDLGIVSAPTHLAGANPRVPPAVRTALFQLTKLGDVGGPVKDEAGNWHVVRLIGQSGARSRSYAEAQRAIRVALARQQLEAAEQRLIDDLRRRYPLVVDEAVLAGVKAAPEPSVQPLSSAFEVPLPDEPSAAPSASSAPSASASSSSTSAAGPAPSSSSAGAPRGSAGH